MVYSHQPGLYADLCACLDAQGLSVVRCDLQPVGHLQMHRFWVVDNATAFKLEHSLLTPVSLAVRDAVVQPSIWKRTHGRSEERGQAQRRNGASETAQHQGAGPAGPHQGRVALARRRQG